MNRKAHGFTIVELLIVIVVIAILAAITIAAYTNIQDRANDAVAQQNLRDAMNKLRVYEAAKGVTPIPNSSSGSELTVAMEGFSVSRNAYVTGNNFIYCRDSTSGVYGIGARSKSGRSFVYSSTDGLQKLSSSLPTNGGGDTGACNTILGMPTGWNWGYTGGWMEWAS